MKWSEGSHEPNILLDYLIFLSEDGFAASSIISYTSILSFIDGKDYTRVTKFVKVQSKYYKSNCAPVFDHEKFKAWMWKMESDEIFSP